MASADLDPSFVKGLKLLLSKSKESHDQLKQMLDEVLDQRKKEVANKSVVNNIVLLMTFACQLIVELQIGD